jgi:hypothetical protein
MYFETDQWDKKIIIFFLLIWCALSVFLAAHSFRLSTSIGLGLSAVLIICGLYMVQLYMKNKTPKIKLEVDGIYLEQEFGGMAASLDKIIPFESARIRLRKNEIKISRIKKVLFLYRPCRLKVVNAKGKSFLTRNAALRVKDYVNFVWEIFRRFKYIELDPASFEEAKNMNIDPGVNVVVLGRQKNSVDSSAQEFIKDYFGKK